MEASNGQSVKYSLQGTVTGTVVDCGHLDCLPPLDSGCRSLILPCYGTVLLTRLSRYTHANAALASVGEYEPKK